MLRPYLNKLITTDTLTQEEMETAAGMILDHADPCQTSAFLAMLKMRGETADEIVGMINAIEKNSKRVALPVQAMDIVGTGGDQANTVNISTGSAILAAACGIPIAKHGNRSVSSKSGSADVLEALGIKVEMEPETLAACIAATNIAFMYAPHYHPSLAKIGSIRRSLRVPTMFNLLGPLLNPAHTPFALIGVAHPASMNKMAQAVVQLNRVKQGLVFHGNGLDELSPLGPIHALRIDEGTLSTVVIDPQALGIRPCTLQELQGSDAEYNARLLNDAFEGKESAIADALILNAGAALWIYGREPTLQQGVDCARAVLASGAAAQLLKKWKDFGEKTNG
jgi:anthranilate phosphoribosyltransferase